MTHTKQPPANPGRFTYRKVNNSDCQDDLPELEWQMVRRRVRSGHLG